MSYLDIDTGYADDDGILMLRREVHRFAKNEIRPAALAIDAMERDEYEAIGAPGSPYWDVMEQMKELGYHRSIFAEEFGGDGITPRELHVLLEEIAWGSPGFAIALGVDLMPALFAAVAFDEALQESFIQPYLEDTSAAFQGCWGVTEYQHGSEFVQVETLLRDGVQDGDPDRVGPPKLTIERDGNGWVVDGVKSSWVSAAPVGTHVALHANMDPAGGDPGYACLVPLDADGVTRGDPIDKLGQRECPQGELVFDTVHVPDRNVVMDPEMLHPDTGYAPITQVLAVTSAFMATTATGLARACFEEALAYARQREQGGKRICDHQSVKGTLYDMFEKVETCRAFSRTVVEHVMDRNLNEFRFDASHRHALTAQVYCKRTAFEVAHDALQIHGANGITTDYAIEKLFRDARVKLIEDGTTEVLGLEAADSVIENYEIE